MNTGLVATARANHPAWQIPDWIELAQRLSDEVEAWHAAALRESHGLSRRQGRIAIHTDCALCDLLVPK